MLRGGYEYPAFGLRLVTGLVHTKGEKGEVCAAGETDGRRLMTEILDAMALAIRAVRAQFGKVPTSVEHDTLPEAEARAALTVALDMTREPSEAMDQAMEEVFSISSEQQPFLSKHWRTQAWKAMHDKLREEVFNEKD